MWRNYVICVLAGLLIATTLSSIVLLRQSLTTRADLSSFRQRAVAAEATRSSLQQQVNQATAAPATPGGNTIVTANATPTPAALALAPTAAPTRQPIAVPTLTIRSSDSPILSQIEAQVVQLRGLQPKEPVRIQMLDQAELQRQYLARFNQDYLPSERESDQKLLSTIGLIGPNENVVQILLDVLQEQILGVYNQDDKTMYLAASKGQFGAAEKDTYAQEYDHALQDQYFDLSALAPKHPDNDDRALAIQAVTQGDATLIQRLWAQQNLSSEELSQLGQGGGASKLLSMPLYLREQLLFPYGDGFTFVRQIYQTGGYQAVDAVFRDPPQSTAQILHIDKYRNHVAPVDVDVPDLASGALGDGWRQISSNVFGELDLRLILTQLTDSTSGVRGASGWAGDRWALLEKDGRQALVSKSIWDSDADARLFIQTFGQAMQNRYFGSHVESATDTRQALTAAQAATEFRRSGRTVVAVISFDRPTAEAIADAVS
jgi:hypothetical protein